MWPRYKISTKTDSRVVTIWFVGNAWYRSCKQKLKCIKTNIWHSFVRVRCLLALCFVLCILWFHNLQSLDCCSPRSRCLGPLSAELTRQVTNEDHGAAEWHDHDIRDFQWLPLREWALRTCISLLARSCSVNWPVSSAQWLAPPDNDSTRPPLLCWWSHHRA